MSILRFAAGNYMYSPSVFQYSSGVAAEEGYEIIRGTFRHPLTLDEGFNAIDKHLKTAGRPRTALCACELRSPAPFSEGGFRSFNERYVAVLETWGICRQGVNPVARTNVCPTIDPPSEAEFYAFSYTYPTDTVAPTFVISGSGEVPEGRSNYADHIIRPGDTSIEGLRDKAAFVLAAMEARMEALGTTWAESTNAQIYTIHDIHPLLPDLFVTRGASRFGLTWHYMRPPVTGLDFEMDCRGIATELLV